MDEVEVNGVFLHSKNLDSEFMLKCLQMLVNNFPEVKIASVEADELHFGYRVYFSSPQKDAVLARKHLIVSGENIRIGPLRTSLTIHGVRKNGGEQYEDELRETICNQFGKLFHFVPESNLENEITRSCRACVDVPELEELEIFNHEGYSDMFVCLPSNREMLKVTFHCRRCKNDGHVLQNCSVLTPPKEEITVKTENFTSDVAKPRPIKLESTHAFAEKIGRGEIMKTGIFPERDQKDKEDKPGPSSTPVKVTKGGIWAPEKFPFVKIKIEVGKHDNPTDVNNSENLHDAKHLINNASGNDGKISKSNIDDHNETREINCHEVLNSSNCRYSFTSTSENRGDETNHAEDYSSAAQFFEELFSSSTHNTTGASSLNAATPPKPAVENTKNLSPQLQACIDSACEECDVIDRDRFEAFLIHVKKSSNPSQIARNFTNHPGKVKALLQGIKLKFFNTKHAATKEDKPFLKWITGLVERFEGTLPLKRKSCDQNHSDSPSKK